MPSLMSSLHVLPPCLPAMSLPPCLPSPPLSPSSTGDPARVWEGSWAPEKPPGIPPHRTPSLLQSLPRSSWSATECGRPRKQRHDVPRPPKATKIEPKLYLRVGDWRSQGLFSEKMPTSRSLCYLPYETHADQLENQHLGTL